MNYEKIFRTWLDSPQLTEEEKAELRRYSEEEKQELFKPEPLRFGTAGIRTIVGLGTQRLNRFTCRWAIKGYSTYLKKKKEKPSVLVVYDKREHGYRLYLEAIFTLLKEGINGYIVGPNNGAISTPIVSYLIRKKSLDGAVNITASHNPANYNGMKLYDSLGKQLDVHEEKNLIKCLPSIEEAILLEVNENIDKNELKWITIAEINDYFKETAENIATALDEETSGIKSQIRILFDGHHGTTAENMKMLMHDLGFTQFKECNTDTDVINPEEASSFREVIRLAEKENIDYVCASDLDGDRGAIAERQEDGSWYFFNGNEIGIITAAFKVQFKKKLGKTYIVSTNVTNTLINKLFPNIPIHITNTGFKNISEIVNREEKKGNNLLIAFEEAMGALIEPIHREKDSYQQIAYLLEAIAYCKSNKHNLKKYLDMLISSVGVWKGLTDFYKGNNKNLDLITDSEKVKEKISELSGYSLEKIEIDQEQGIVSWFMNQNSWIKFRYSRTEPKLKIYYNLFWKKENELNRFINNFKAHLDSLFQI
ncbi:phosphomannomutase [Candidatus Mycoplasma haematohominis]|uniref:phosphomannomutase n=1 Tax=Candidatus Mycoplasma haematohominis TaxID=1494318 RepID=UPI001C0A6FAA|nr:phosphomannomutase [Candidatus Mycoplasma haemohominis]